MIKTIVLTPPEREAIEKCLRRILTPAKLERLRQSSAALGFTPAERQGLLRKDEADLQWIAAAKTPKESERRAEQVWQKTVEGPRVTRRIEQARKVAPAQARPTRPERTTRIARSAAVRTKTPSRGDPDDDDPHEQPRRCEHCGTALRELKPNPRNMGHANISITSTATAT
jgi:hypothetical protein